ncbi:MAG: HutD family protein [Candidatus Eremiobacteraeota bacterium]|nr:HutD family protein [Candidatus Eremiobacteraeota bacterium]
MIELLRPSQYRRQRWKNGGGVTDEIAADAESPPAWRVSIATIERDGPFSDFRGYDRTIVALDDGVTLTVDGNDVPLRRHEPCEFRGEAAVEAHVTATARDFNVMTLRGAFAHNVEVVTTPQRYLVDEDELLFAYVLCGEATVFDLHCAEGETAYLDAVERFDVIPGADSAVCVIHITPR